MNIDTLKAASEKLQQLLSDPQPGLATWNGMLAERLQEVASYLGQPVRAAQAGWKVVPIEPTPDMLAALGLLGEPRAIYAAVMRAAPSGEPLMADEQLILDQLKRIAELEALVYVPGLWRCAKCKLTMVSSVLNMARGTVGANVSPQQCPNECGPLWRVTERDAGNQLADRVNDLRNDVLEQAAKICEGYGKAPAKAVVHFLGQIAQDVREIDDAPKRAAAVEIARVIRALKGPA